jgi:hypothetical protein
MKLLWVMLQGIVWHSVQLCGMSDNLSPRVKKENHASANVKANVKSGNHPVSIEKRKQAVSFFLNF